MDSAFVSAVITALVAAPLTVIAWQRFTREQRKEIKHEHDLRTKAADEYTLQLFKVQGDQIAALTRRADDCDNRAAILARDLEKVRVDLTAERQRSRAIMDSFHDGIVIVNPEGRITYANSSMLRFAGWGMDLVGQPLKVLIPDEVEHLHRKHREQYMQAPTARPMGADLDLKLKTKTDERVPVSISLSPQNTGEIMATVRPLYGRRREDRKQAA